MQATLCAYIAYIHNPNKHQILISYSQYSLFERKRCFATSTKVHTEREITGDYSKALYDCQTPLLNI